MPRNVNLDSFNSNIQKELSYELERRKHLNQGKDSLISVYFGGGTPSLATPGLVEKSMEVFDKFGYRDIKEVTLEANPTGLDLDLLNAFKSAGINRLSLGVQSLHDNDLKFFNRDHNVKDATRGIEMALQIFNNTSLDFIWGRPNQSLQDWTKELDLVTLFGSKHLSLYQLTVERGTKLYHQVSQDKSVTMPDDDEMADLFELTRSKLKSAGYDQYEVSSFAKSKEFQSQHNIGYWSGRDYIGVGPGAHGRLLRGNKRFRTYRTMSPSLWSDQINILGHGIQKEKVIDDGEMQNELVLVGLRQAKGIDGAEFLLMTGATLDDILDWNEIKTLKEINLITTAANSRGQLENIKCTFDGLAVADKIAARILK